MKSEPQKEHQWLQKLIGDWTSEMNSKMGPGKPSETLRGSESVRSLGGLWIIGEGSGEMPGGEPAKMMLTLGYDPAKTRFVGTWVGSMMTQLWVYEGTLNEAGTILTLDTEGPSFTAEGKRARFQDIIEIRSDDHRTLTSRTLGEDGQWQEFMTVHYRRVR